MRQLETRTLYTSVTSCLHVDAWGRAVALGRPTRRHDGVVVPTPQSGEEVGMTETEGRKRPKYLRLGEVAGVVRAAPEDDSVLGDRALGDRAPAFTLTVGELGLLVREAVGVATEKVAPAPRLLDREALSLALSCSGSMVDKLRRGGMPFVRLGDSPRFELERCLEWLRKEGAA